jgi:pilus assembly protein CpaF
MFTISVRDDHNKLLDTVQCRASSCTVGRSSKNLIHLNGWRIDGIHAEFTEKADGVYVSDRSSGAGISLNGKKAASGGPLTAATGITIGSFVLTVLPEHQATPSPKEATPPTPKPPPRQETEDMPAQQSAVLQAPPPPKTAKPPSQAGKDIPYRWHKLIHTKLMQAMDLRRTDVESMDEQQLKKTIQAMIAEIIQHQANSLPANIDRKRLARDVLHEAIGLGPLEDFLADDSITEIMVNRYDDIYLERNGLLEKSPVTFSSDEAVRSIIERIVSPLGRRIDESSPMVDARLEDGSRVNAIIPPLAIHGPCLTIRKFSRNKLSSDDYINFGSISPDMVTFLHTAVMNRKNIIISGGTGSGKTTFLNVISSFIPHTERIVTVEDSAELRLEQPHVVSLEARPANMEGKGEVTIRDLVRNCLRMRPDRIVVGECRGSETLDMLQAMNTGHDGSITTVHANSPRDLISRLEVMVMMAGMDLPEHAILEQITSAVHLIVQQSRFGDGSRRITHITEITGQDSGVVQMQNIFVFKQRGFDEHGKIIGDFESTGRIPEFYEMLRDRGISVDMGIFNNQ